MELLGCFQGLAIGPMLTISSIFYRLGYPRLLRYSLKTVQSQKTQLASMVAVYYPGYVLSYIHLSTGTIQLAYLQRGIIASKQCIVVGQYILPTLNVLKYRVIVHKECLNSSATAA